MRKFRVQVCIPCYTSLTGELMVEAENAEEAEEKVQRMWDENGFSRLEMEEGTAQPDGDCLIDFVEEVTDED